MVFKSGVTNLQTVGYNGAHTLHTRIQFSMIEKSRTIEFKDAELVLFLF